MLVIAYNQALIDRQKNKQTEQRHAKPSKISWWKKMWEMYDDKQPELIEDDERMDIIGQNGNDGLHYDEVDIPNEPREENDPQPKRTLKGGVKIQ